MGMVHEFGRPSPGFQVIEFADDRPQNKTSTFWQSSHPQPSIRGRLVKYFPEKKVCDFMRRSHQSHMSPQTAPEGIGKGLTLHRSSNF